jgi:uncharacterized protein YciI
MFVIELKYKADIDIVDKYLGMHREWLQKQYDNELLLCSGPQNPRDGGFIIALGNNRQQIENMMLEDPFTINKISEYKITEFDPVKRHKNIQELN